MLGTCADKNVNIVILGFLTYATFGGSAYPRLQLVSTCSERDANNGANGHEQSSTLPSTKTPQMIDLAPGLSFYATLEAEIT